LLQDDLFELRSGFVGVCIREESLQRKMVLVVNRRVIVSWFDLAVQVHGFHVRAGLATHRLPCKYSPRSESKPLVTSK